MQSVYLKLTCQDEINKNANSFLLFQNVPVACVPTGVKHLHHKALEFDIGVYFEANGHGTVVFSEEAEAKISEAAKAAASQSSESGIAAQKLRNLVDVINQVKKC